ncbi:MAG: 23S rRNA (cytosine1962-C5)-methyltransferase [Planctomycetota bacterium]|jgi:23S rRNA (cytosine1962-C5)-methyltransferase
MQQSIFPSPEFPSYALLDSGDGEKLERFGPVVLRRPDPQALWRPRQKPEVWSRADLNFVRESDRGGRWEAARGAAMEARGKEPSWTIEYGDARFLIRPTPFKHVGLFPEQAANWSFVADRAEVHGKGAKLLNLFGYSGAASVLAAQAGFDVTHVDASKASLNWTRDNARASGLGERALRVVHEDALVFAKREARRGNKYAGVLLDPPHYGRGPKGEKWQFEQMFASLLEAAEQLLDERSFLVLSTYAIGYSPLAFHNLLSEFKGGQVEAGELALAEENGERLLPCGFCARWWRE